LTNGGYLGKAPRYNKSICFDNFPFPEATEEQQQRIREIAEKVDAHRKQRQEENPKLNLTNMYGILDDMRLGVHLDAKKEKISQEGDLPTLYRLHQELDVAVAEAYGWPVDITTDDILANLLELNQKRTKEEKSGQVKWLRPEFQAQN